MLVDRRRRGPLARRARCGPSHEFYGERPGGVGRLRPDRQRAPLRPADGAARRRRVRRRGRPAATATAADAVPRADGARRRRARRRGDGRGDLRPDPAGDRRRRRRRGDPASSTTATKPLALYVFTGNDALAERVLERTRSGGAGVNHVMMHLAVSELPFGGVGASGTGAYHGTAGFETFSHRRSVLVQADQTRSRAALPAVQALEGDHPAPGPLTPAADLVTLRLKGDLSPPFSISRTSVTDRQVTSGFRLEASDPRRRCAHAHRSRRPPQPGRDASRPRSGADCSAIRNVAAEMPLRSSCRPDTVLPPARRAVRWHFRGPNNAIDAPPWSEPVHRPPIQQDSPISKKVGDQIGRRAGRRPTGGGMCVTLRRQRKGSPSSPAGTVPAAVPSRRSASRPTGPRGLSATGVPSLPV